MTALSVAEPRSANIACANVGNKTSAPSCELVALDFSAKNGKWFTGLAKWLSSAKPATVIHQLTGEPERTCYRWVEGSADPTARAFIKMLRSSEGERVLDFVMRGCTQPWWKRLDRARKVASAYDDASRQYELDLGGQDERQLSRI